MYIKKHIIDVGLVQHESEDEYALVLSPDERKILQRAANIACNARQLLQEHHSKISGIEHSELLEHQHVEDTLMDTVLAEIYYGSNELLDWTGPIE